MRCLVQQKKNNKFQKLSLNWGNLTRRLTNILHLFSGTLPMCIKHFTVVKYDQFLYPGMIF